LNDGKITGLWSSMIKYRAATESWAVHGLRVPSTAAAIPGKEAAAIVDRIAAARHAILIWRRRRMNFAIILERFLYRDVIAGDRRITVCIVCIDRPKLGHIQHRLSIENILDARL